MNGYNQALRIMPPSHSDMEDYAAQKRLESLTASDPDELIDPEPFSVFLGVLGFVGSVASIVSYIEYLREQRQRVVEDRNRLVREARDLLMALEADTMQMEAS